jgi:hypothetical protein
VNQSAAITLTSIQEDAQGNISGNLQVSPPLSGTGTIKGSVARNNTIKFISYPTDGSAPISWVGVISANGSINGTYSVPNYSQQGKWQASPV